MDRGDDMQEIFAKIREKLERQQNVNRYTFHNDEWNVGVDQAIKIVSQVETEYSNPKNPNKSENPTSSDGWIPCSERLPEKPKFCEDSYLVQEDVVVTPYSAYWDGECWSETDGTVLSGIIAWQQLPAPYKPKEEMQ